MFVNNIFRWAMNDIGDFIQEVKRSNDIVDVIGSYIELRSRGANFQARCPFHGEKTPSFNVNRNKQFFKCFGCGESGDVLGFVQKYESCSFMEALEILAKRANLKMPELTVDKRDKLYEEKKKKKDIFLSVLKETAIFYYKSFYSERGSAARKYMEQRGFDAETLKKFGIGYSPDMYSLPKYLSDKKFVSEICLEAGVLQRKSDGTVFDALAGRLIVPIFNIAKNVIAFGGRGLDDKTIAFGKYKNTSETPLFLKKDNLYAINIAKEQKQQSQLPYIVVVEGYMDVIAMYQAGFKKAVASMGTSLTERQAKLLSRLSETVYICYDGDSAGQKATVRGLDILDEAGLDVKVMSVPDKLDPDEYIKKYGADAFEKLIDDALPLPDYKLKLLSDAFDIYDSNASNRNDALSKFAKGAVILLQKLDDIKRARYITAVSLKTGYSEDFFKRKLAGLDKADAEVAKISVAPVSSGETKALYFVAACLLNNADFAVLDEKPSVDSTFLDSIYAYLFECKKLNAEPRLDNLFTVCPDASKEEYASITDVDFSSENYAKNKAYFLECKNLITVEGYRRERDLLLKKLKTADESQTAELFSEIEKINAKINSVK